MRVFSLKPDYLRVLDTALHGCLADALVAVGREGGDPVLCVERVRSVDGTPSSWFVVVSGGTRTYRFEVTDPAGLGIAARVYFSDHLAELTADLSAKVQRDEAAEQMEFDFRHPLPRHTRGDPS